MDSYLLLLKTELPAYVCHKIDSLAGDEDTMVLLYEFFIERAGIRQYDAHMKRTEAESEALKDTIIYFYSFVTNRTKNRI